MVRRFRFTRGDSLDRDKVHQQQQLKSLSFFWFDGIDIPIVVDDVGNDDAAFPDDPTGAQIPFDDDV